MNVSDSDRAVITETVRLWDGARVVSSIEPLTPDASLRRYFRVTAGGGTTIIASIFDSIASPEAGGASSVNSFDASIQLGRFFHKNGVPVPEIYYERREPYLLLSEDLGDRLLAHNLVATSGLTANLGLHGREPSSGDTEVNYTRAIDALLAISRIPVKAGFFPFERAFTAETYSREMSEFQDFVFAGGDDKERASISDAFARLAHELAALPRVLVHRDFHSWNLMIDRAGKLRVIDFQDALMATRPYDVVALLNDRDTDSALGDELSVRLIHYFRERAGYGSKDEFAAEYDRVLLQRDLKVAGRFRKLVQVRGLTQYGAWVPGTLRRIGRTLARLEDYRELREVLVRNIPEIAGGTKEPLSYT